MPIREPFDRAASAILLPCVPYVGRASIFVQKLTGWSRETLFWGIFWAGIIPYTLGLWTMGSLWVAALFGVFDRCIKHGPHTIGVAGFEFAVLCLSGSLLSALLVAPIALLLTLHPLPFLAFPAGVVVAGFLEAIAVMVRGGPDVPEADRVFDWAVAGETTSTGDRK